MIANYTERYNSSVNDPGAFWSDYAENFHWYVDAAATILIPLIHLLQGKGSGIAVMFCNLTLIAQKEKSSANGLTVSHVG